MRESGSERGRKGGEGGSLSVRKEPEISEYIIASDSSTRPIG